LLADEGIWLPSAPRAEGISPAFSIKRPQSFAALDFRPHLAEIWSSPGSNPATQAHHERERANQ
jgi:hypothetical protein